jgi:hypothetical protein
MNIEVNKIIHLQEVLKTCIIRISKLYSEPLSSGSSQWHVSEQIKKQKLPIILQKPEDEYYMILLPTIKITYTYKHLYELSKDKLSYIYKYFNKMYKGIFVSEEVFIGILKKYDEVREFYTYIPVEFLTLYIMALDPEIEIPASKNKKRDLKIK